MAISTKTQPNRNTANASTITFKGNNLKDQVYRLLLIANNKSVYFPISEIQAMLGTIETRGSGWNAQTTMMMPPTEDVETVVNELIEDGLIITTHAFSWEHTDAQIHCKALSPHEIAQMKQDKRLKSLNNSNKS